MVDRIVDQYGISFLGVTLDRQGNTRDDTAIKKNRFFIDGIAMTSLLPIDDGIKQRIRNDGIAIDPLGNCFS